MEEGETSNASCLPYGTRGATSPGDRLVASLEALNNRRSDLFTQEGNPLRDESAIFDITNSLLEGSPDPNRINEILNNLNELGTQSQWFVGALAAKNYYDINMDNISVLDNMNTSSSSSDSEEDGRNR